VDDGCEPAPALAGRVASYGLAEQERTVARGVGVLGSGHGSTVPDPGRFQGVSSTGLPLAPDIR
jgi:hypothetical protein